jgi:hypothetical protein
MTHQAIDRRLRPIRSTHDGQRLHERAPRLNGRPTGVRAKKNCPSSLATSSHMNRLGARDASLLRLPACVGNREADAARPVAGGPRVLFCEEEDPVGDIAAPGDGAQRGGAVETARCGYGGGHPVSLAECWCTVRRQDRRVSRSDS